MREALFTGGLPPIGRHPDEVYRATFARVQERCRRYYEAYPEDRARVLAAGELAPVLASGDRLSHGRLRQLGNMLGMSDGQLQLHAVLELPPGSPAFAHDAEALGFARNPIYAILHESSYADGHATRWSAERVLPQAYADDPALLTGEHVFPWMFEELGRCVPCGGRRAARRAPVAAPVRRRGAGRQPRAGGGGHLHGGPVRRARVLEETAAAVRGLRPWVTSEYEHDGLRTDGGRILGRLLDLARGRA
jgi:hypothetical protein